MGRGRQKAKDAKIARQLKYTSHSGDLRDLERELLGGKGEPVVLAAPVDDEPEDAEDEFYDRWADDDDEDDDK